jgi:alpha-glucoside transport system substrate-binding protein
VEDVDRSVGVFPLPGRTPEDRPVLARGQLAAVFNQADGAARQLVQFMASPDFGTNGHGAGGMWISPRTDFDQELYPDETWRAIARIAYESTEFVLDGSDQMPREVGSRLLPREMTAWISGEQDLQTMLADIEAGWPT